jgi:uridine monophosphate synthetase
MSRDLVETVKAFISANQTGPNASGNEMGAVEPEKRMTYTVGSPAHSPTRMLNRNLLARMMSG